MDSVNEFEHEADNRTSINKNYVLFPVEANTHYKYSSADDLLNNLDDLADMVKDHIQSQVPRLQVLDDYYKARNTNIIVNKRRKEPEKADHRAAHNFAKVITQFDVGYNTGNAIKIEIEDEDHQTTIDDFNTINDIEGLNSEIWLDMDKYGRAYELQYRSEADQNEVALSNVFETFVIYDTTIRRNPIAAVRYVQTGFKRDDGATKIQVVVYTDNDVVTFEPTSKDQIKLVVENKAPHQFNEVPIVEYATNRFRQGIYEDVLSLIDLYDAAQSDTANYMSDFAEAMLVLTGDIESTGFTANDLIKMKSANIMALQSGTDIEGKQTNVSASYLYRQYDVNGTEAYKKRVHNDIHEIANVPDLTDENFSGTQSGEAMKYKLFGFEQMTDTKQRLFKKGLMRRYRLLFNLRANIKASKDIDMNDLKVTFTANLPKAIIEELKVYIEAGGELSEETLLGLFSLVDKPADEISKVKEQHENEIPILPDNYFEHDEIQPNDTELDEGQSASTLSANDKTINQVSLNGAQITSMIAIVQEVASGKLPYDSGLEMLVSAFPFDEAKAKAILGEAGKKFKLTGDKEVTTNVE